MAVLRQLRRRGAAIALLAGIVAVGPAACTGSPDGQRTPQPADVAARTAESRQLRTPLSVQVVARVDPAACVEGAGGSPGPGAGGDWCYFLDPGLDVARAQGVEVVQDQTRDYVVAVTLTPEDRDDFSAWTAQAAGRQIAISVQGRVVQAPELRERLSGDQILIFGLTEADARALMRQLTG